jgi:hypothetical protein
MNVKPNLHMMKKLFYFLAVAFAVMLTTANASAQSNRDTRNVSDFTEVGFGIAGNLTIKIGSPFSVVLEGDRDYLSEVETVVKNGKLIIKCDNFRILRNQKVNVFITMPSIKGLGVSGSGEARVENAVSADAFSASLSGSGKIFMKDLTADSFYCNISGSGEVIVEGKGGADRGNVTISGSGNYTGGNFEIDKLTVNISGSGGIDCKVVDSLASNISGSGNVVYSGNPKVDSRSSGSGHVRSK